MDTNLLDDSTAGRTIDPPTPEQSLLAHLMLGRLAYGAYSEQRHQQMGNDYAPWDSLGDELRYAWAIAAHAVLARALVMQDHEAAVMRVIAEPKAAEDGDPPPLLPPPPVK
jgi:hypothetical protein